MRWVLLGLLVAAAGLGYGLLPQSESYSDWGFGNEGLVDVECGSAFSEDVNPVFRDYAEGEAYFADVMSGYEPAIFDGQTAARVCEDLLSGTRTTAIAAIAIGSLVAVFGFVRTVGAGSSNSGELSTSGSLHDPPPPTLPLPPPQAAPHLATTPPADEPLAESTTSPSLLFADGQRVELVDQLVIGRDPEDPTVTSPAGLLKVDDATVSKTHLRVGATGEDVWIEDLHSRNGVSIVASNGEVTTTRPGSQMIIDIGDQVVVGDLTSFTLTNGFTPTADRTS